jgi:hypothetical protein
VAKIKLLDQIETALFSDETSDAIRLWIWVKFFADGCSVTELLESGLPNVVPSCNSLITNGRLRISDGAIRTSAFLRSAAVHVEEIEKKKEPDDSPEFWVSALEEPTKKRNKPAVNAAEIWVFDAYNEGRARKKLKPLPDQQRARFSDKWQALAYFALTNEVDLPKFFEFAYEKTRWQENKYPPPALFGGEWIRIEWIDRDTSKKSREHAGKVYQEAPGLEGQLKAAGFDTKGLDALMLRHIVRMARTLKMTPHLREPHKEESIEKMVHWTAQNHEF